MSITCREKLEMDHPEFIDEKWDGDCKDCPGTYGYRDNEFDGLCDCKTCNNDICTKCWDQPYEGELTELEKKYIELKKDFIRRTEFMDMARKERNESNAALRDIWYHVGCGYLYYYPRFTSNTKTDIIEGYDDMKASRNRWRITWIGTVVGLVIGVIIRLTIGG